MDLNDRRCNEDLNTMRPRGKTGLTVSKNPNQASSNSPGKNLRSSVKQSEQAVINNDAVRDKACEPRKSGLRLRLNVKETESFPVEQSPSLIRNDENEPSFNQLRTKVGILRAKTTTAPPPIKSVVPEVTEEALQPRTRSKNLNLPLASVVNKEKAVASASTEIVELDAPGRAQQSNASPQKRKLPPVSGESSRLSETSDYKKKKSTRSSKKKKLVEQCLAKEENVSAELFPCSQSGFVHWDWEQSHNTSQDNFDDFLVPAPLAIKKPLTSVKSPRQSNLFAELDEQLDVLKCDSGWLGDEDDMDDAKAGSETKCIEQLSCHLEVLETKAAVAIESTDSDEEEANECQDNNSALASPAPTSPASSWYKVSQIAVCTEVVATKRSVLATVTSSKTSIIDKPSTSTTVLSEKVERVTKVQSQLPFSVLSKNSSTTSFPEARNEKWATASQAPPKSNPALLTSPAAEKIIKADSKELSPLTNAIPDDDSMSEFLDCVQEVEDRCRRSQLASQVAKPASGADNTVLGKNSNSNAPPLSSSVSTLSSASLSQVATKPLESAKFSASQNPSVSTAMLPPRRSPRTVGLARRHATPIKLSVVPPTGGQPKMNEDFSPDWVENIKHATSPLNGSFSASQSPSDSQNGIASQKHTPENMASLSKTSSRTLFKTSTPVTSRTGMKRSIKSCPSTTPPQKSPAKKVVKKENKSEVATPAVLNKSIDPFEDSLCDNLEDIAQLEEKIFSQIATQRVETEPKNSKCKVENNAPPSSQILTQKRLATGNVSAAPAKPTIPSCNFKTSFPYESAQNNKISQVQEQTRKPATAFSAADKINKPQTVTKVAPTGFQKDNSVVNNSHVLQQPQRKTNPPTFGNLETSAKNLVTVSSVGTRASSSVLKTTGALVNFPSSVNKPMSPSFGQAGSLATSVPATSVAPKPQRFGVSSTLNATRQNNSSFMTSASHARPSFPAPSQSRQFGSSSINNQPKSGFIGTNNKATAPKPFGQNAKPPNSIGSTVPPKPTPVMTQKVPVSASAPTNVAGRNAPLSIPTKPNSVPATAQITLRSQTTAAITTQPKATAGFGNGYGGHAPKVPYHQSLRGSALTRHKSFEMTSAPTMVSNNTPSPAQSAASALSSFRKSVGSPLVRHRSAGDIEAKGSSNQQQQRCTAEEIERKRQEAKQRLLQRRMQSNNKT